MKSAWIPFCVLLALVACQNSKPKKIEQSKQEPAKILPVAPDDTTSVSQEPAVGDSLWLPLTVEGARWTLFDELADAGTERDRIEIKVVNRRVIRGVVIANLDWAFISEGKRSEVEVSIPVVVVSNGRKVKLYESGVDLTGMTDDDFLNELRDDPSYQDPPEAFRNSEDWGTEFLSLKDSPKGKLFCLGQGPPDEEDFQCEDTCYATLCYSKAHGIVGINGTWAPQFGHFAAKGFKDLIP